MNDANFMAAALAQAQDAADAGEVPVGAVVVKDGLVIATGMAIGTSFTLFVVPSFYILVAENRRPKTV